MIAKNCDPPFPEKEALTKVESAVKRVNAKDRNITQEVREWILASPGIFSSSDIHKELDFASSSLKHAVTNCLGRLCQEGLIARQGNRRGMYRRVEQEAEHIDWRKAPTAEYPLRLPFDLERMVKIFPKNIILIAGDPNSGKTALMLNIVKDNMKDLPVWYFSSEMGGVEMRERIAMFDDPPPDAWTFKAVERSHGFADVIRPDALNIIDYLEVHKDFWEVGGWIREIHDRLKKGVAVIASAEEAQRGAGPGGRNVPRKTEALPVRFGQAARRQHPFDRQGQELPGQDGQPQRQEAGFQDRQRLPADRIGGVEASVTSKGKTSGRRPEPHEGATLPRPGESASARGLTC